MGRIARTAADGVGAREWLEMGGEKKPLGMSELGCADGCGRPMGEENCTDGRTAADGVGAREWLEMGGEKKPLVMSELGCADGCGREMGAACMGAREWLEMRGEEKPLVMSELGCADGCGREMGADWVRRIARTAWVPGSGWKCVGRRSRW